MSETFRQQFKDIDAAASFADRFPVFKHFPDMFVDLIAARPAIVDDAFFKDRISLRERDPAVFRIDDPLFTPVEIDIFDLDPGNAGILITAEHAAVEGDVKTFEFRPEAADLLCHLFGDLNSSRTADRKGEDILQPCIVLLVEIQHMIETVNKSLAARDDISHEQSPVRYDRQFAVAGIQSDDLLTVKNTLAGQETDVMHRNAL